MSWATSVHNKKIYKLSTKNLQKFAALNDSHALLTRYLLSVSL